MVGRPGPGTQAALHRGRPAIAGRREVVAGQGELDRRGHRLRRHRRSRCCLCILLGDSEREASDHLQRQKGQEEED